MVTTRRPGQGGYTFVEMMVAMGIAVIVGVGIYGIFAFQRRAGDSQRIMTELQSGSRFAMDQIKKELTLAGYRAQNTVQPVKVADPEGVAFEYWDERAAFEAPFTPAAAPSSGYTRHTLVSFRLQGGNLVRTVRRWYQGTSAATSSYLPGTASLSEADVRADFAAITDPVYLQTLATNVEAFDLRYFKQNNEPWDRDPDGNPATAPPFDEIRSVVVSLTARSAEANPIFRDANLGAAGQERFPSIRLQSEIRLRNVDIAVNPRDRTPPAVPGSPLAGVPSDQRDLRIWDPGLCDTLELSWGANVEADLAGYTLFYGLASGSYSNRVRIARGPGAPGARVSHTLTGLQATRACDTIPATYYFKLEAFDKSGNPSARTATEVSGNPSPSIASLAGTSPTASDTTINPAPPTAPTGLVATTPTDNQIQLDWSPSTVVGLVGYRLYRSTTGSGFGPVGSVAGTGNCIADERTLGPGVLSFLDTGAFLNPAVLQGCTTYHYKLAAIHCDGCLPEARTNFTSASATTVDVTPPPCPVIEADAGMWKRIQLRLDNPLRSAVPDYAYTKVWQSTSGLPAYDDHGTPTDPADDTVTGALIPDSAGTFTVDGTVAVNFDSDSVPDPGPPALQVDTQYYFLAVGYDRCGNVCSPSMDTATARTAAVDSTDLPPGAPPAATGLAATAGCGVDITLTWTPPSTSFYTDFAGVHVYRCARQYHSHCGEADWVELTDGYLAAPPFTDSQAGGLEVGRFYSYRIRSTDNYYEDHHLTWDGTATGTGDPANDPNDNYSDAFIEGLYIGGIEREERFPGPSARLAEPVSATDAEIPVDSETYRAENFPSDAVTGVFTIIVDEEILACAGARIPAGTDAGAFTGCSRGTGGTQAAGHARGAIVVPRPSTRPIQALCGDLDEEPPSFIHNTVEFWLRNTAAGPLTLNTLSASWQNGTAFLERIDLGDGATTPVSYVWSDAANPLTAGSAGISLTLTDAELSPRDEMIPVSLTFRSADRTVSGVNNNMREEQLDLSLGFRNDATGDAACATNVKVNVPLGPFISGTTQSLPQEGTVATPVPGDGGLNPMNGILVPGNQRVDVFTKVSDYDYAGIREVRLYSYVDAGKTLSAAPPLDANAHYENLSPYSRIDLVPVAGNQWRTPIGQGIEPSNDANVWYFIVAVDNNGNFDREPEPGSGAFQYYQQPHDVCKNVPGPPLLSWGTSAGTVTLQWTAPALNTDKSPCTDIGGYNVYRLAASAGPVLLAEIPAGTLTYTDTPPAMDTVTYSYYVTARDTCELPGPNEGAESNWVTECVGAAGCTVQLAANQLDPDFFRAGDGFTVELFACEKINGVAGETLYVQACSGVDSGTVSLAESSDSGKFRMVTGQFTTSLSEPAGADSLDLRVSADDTVTVSAWSATAPTGACGSLTQCSGSLAVVSDACSSVPAPTQPTLNVYISGSGCSSSSPRVSLSWTGADPGQLLFYRLYRCSNQDGTTDCTPVKDGSKIYPTGLEPSLSQTTRTRTDYPQRRPDRNRIWYQVQAVSHNGCADSTRWRTAISPAVVDNCP